MAHARCRTQRTDAACGNRYADGAAGLGVVLAMKVGKHRPFWRGFLLALGSLGIYGRYWDYRAHNEVYQQFELVREGREQGVPWYFMAYPLPVLKFVYYYHFVSNVRYVRARMGFQRSLSAGSFLALVITAASTLFAAFLVGLPLIARGMTSRPDGSIAVVDAALVELGQTVLIVGFVAWIALRATAYFRLQSDVNGIWDVYDARARELRQAASAPRNAPTSQTAAPPQAARGSPPRPAPSSSSSTPPRPSPRRQGPPG
jgi:hypothetical protein